MSPEKPVGLRRRWNSWNTSVRVTSRCYALLATRICYSPPVIRLFRNPSFLLFVYPRFFQPAAKVFLCLFIVFPTIFSAPELPLLVCAVGRTPSYDSKRRSLFFHISHKSFGEPLALCGGFRHTKKTARNLAVFHLKFCFTLCLITTQRNAIYYFIP